MAAGPSAADRRLRQDRWHLGQQEQPLAARVVAYIGDRPFLWLAVADEAGPDSRRGVVERNAISLFCKCGRDPRDLHSEDWLGHHSDRERVRRSGLWNNNHVDESYDPAFLDVLEGLVKAMSDVANDQLS